MKEIPDLVIEDYVFRYGEVSKVDFEENGDMIIMLVETKSETYRFEVSQEVKDDIVYNVIRLWTARAILTDDMKKDV